MMVLFSKETMATRMMENEYKTQNSITMKQQAFPISNNTSNTNTTENMTLLLHEFIELYDWEGVLGLLKNSNSDIHATEQQQQQQHKALASQWKQLSIVAPEEEEEEEEKHLQGDDNDAPLSPLLFEELLLLPLHRRELYEPGIWYQVIECIVEAYPGALNQPIINKMNKCQYHATNAGRRTNTSSSSSSSSSNNDNDNNNNTQQQDDSTSTCSCSCVNNKYPIHIALETMLETQMELLHDLQQQQECNDETNTKKCYYYNLLNDEGYHKHCISVLELFIKYTSSHILMIPNDDGLLPIHLALQLHHMNKPLVELLLLKAKSKHC